MDTKGLQKEFINWCKSKNKQPKSEDETKQLFVAFMKEKHPEEYKAAMENQQKQAQKALHGAKLNYFKSLKNQCAEDEEVVYYKKGGSVRCGCKKKEEGGEVVKAQDGAVAKFKARKAKSGITLSAVADATGSQGGFRNAQLKKKEEEKKPSSTQQPKKEIKEGWDKHGNYIVSKKGMNEREKQLNANKNEEGKADPNKKIQQKKKCGGEIKKNEDGSKINKNCSGAVAKFKMHRQGGSLNGITFMQTRIPKGAIAH